MTTRYVNTASTAGGNGTTNDTAGDNRAYATLSEAEASVAATLTDVWDIICEGTAADATAFYILDIVTSAANYLSIRTTQAARHDGKWNTGKYRLVASGDIFGVIFVGVNYIRIDGVQIHATPSGDTTAAIHVGDGYIAAANDVRLSHSILRMAGNATYAEQALLCADADIIAKVWNCAIYGASTNATSAGIIFNGASASIYSCTVQSGTYGVLRNTGTVTCKNVYAAGSAGNAFSGTITQTNCAASDTTASGTDPHDNVALNTDTFVNVTAGSEDFHLAADGLSPLQGHGIDTSGDSAPLNFTTDIDGETRTGAWDIGADDKVGATPSSTPSATPSATVSATPSATVSATPSRTPSATPSATPSNTPSATAISAIEGTTCWGHVTGVTETNVLTFSGDWTGTGAIEGAGDAEKVALDSTEYMQTLDAVHTGVSTVTITKNKYGTGDAEVLVYYRHAAALADVDEAAWVQYAAPFESLGYVQLRVEAT